MTVVVNIGRRFEWQKKSYFIQAHGRLDDAIHPIGMNRKNAFANEPLSCLSSRVWAFEDRMCINLLVNRSMD